MLIKITKKEIFIIYFFINDFYKWFNLMREKERKKERYETKQSYISSIIPCGSTTTGNMSYCQKNVNY